MWIKLSLLVTRHGEAAIDGNGEPYAVIAPSFSLDRGLLMKFSRGDLVHTNDGYYGIVLQSGVHLPSVLVEVFCGNGLRIMYHPDELELVPFHNFAELLSP